MLLRRAAPLSRKLVSVSCAKAAMSVVTSSPEVLITEQNGLGRITLARNRQLNALGAEHVEVIQQQLLAWADGSRGVKAVLLDSDNERSFCSGGDVKAARQAVLDNPYPDFPPPGHHIHRVFQAEYSTVLLVANYSIPLVSLCQGIWMGLGFGIAGFGRHRVVSDGTVFAMPENTIGLWPDVGFAFKAAHMPGHLGLFLGLTGVRITSPADLLYTGIATHYIPGEQLQAFKDDLCQQAGALGSLLDHYSSPPPDRPGPLQRLQTVIDKHLAQLIAAWKQGGCEELGALHRTLERLQQELPALHSTDHQAAELLQHAINGWAYGSPRSLVITLQHYTNVHDAVHTLEAAGMKSDLQDRPDGLGLCTLEGVMHMEYRMAVRQVAHEDFIEGVRAALIDKDRRPAWLELTVHQQLPADHNIKTANVSERQALQGNRFSVQQLFEPLSRGQGKESFDALTMP